MIIKTTNYAYLGNLLKNDITAQVVLGAVSEGAVAIDRTGRIVFVNRRMEEIFGYSTDELIGSSLERLLPISLIDRHRHHVHSYFEAPHTREMGKGIDLLARHKDGTEFPVEIGLSCLSLPEGSFAVAFVADISVRKKTERDLLIRNAELNAFAHTVAHDLNGALTPIIGYSELLAETCENLSPSELKRDLGTIAKSGRKMSDIIKNLLLLASMRTENIVFAPLDTAAIVQEALHRLQYAVLDSHAEIVLPTSYPSAMGFAPWVEEIWFNYLSNGLKYGGKPPRLEIGAQKEDAGHIRFWVRDNGSGIRQEDIPKLFLPLSQLEHPASKGYGLGLSIVQRIAHKLEGHAGVESELGKNSTFFFTLKNADAQPNAIIVTPQK